jgi:hypothetical protein
MTTNPVRRQVLRALGGLVLAPVSVRQPGDGQGTHSHPVQHDLLAAMEDSALLQIDFTEMHEVVSAMGNAPSVCAVLHGPDVGAVVKQFGDVLAQHHYPFNAVLVVVSGNQSIRLDHCRAVFAAVTDATVNSASTKAGGCDATRTARNRLQSGLYAPPMVLHGVVVDAAITNGLRITMLAA